MSKIMIGTVIEGIVEILVALNKYNLAIDGDKPATAEQVQALQDAMQSKLALVSERLKAAQVVTPPTS